MRWAPVLHGLGPIAIASGSVKHRDRLEVVGVGEHVEGAHGADGVARAQQGAQVPGERRRVTGDELSNRRLELFF